ncbi:hypothetical protein BO70DRAFT_391753 [Aspergillus heteromorphus CBS 117.55]|uniref:Uncharacterized protein n=1 Tax=Aspergillus heteromorphus CBS 117.55 TaxID=1448321 RepID=A0A317X0Z6_9EURO|nr:uncharacterized protein BO70DRAFT_391753 [Aspergillus heteromorphus CBS 117.55]PWY92339.1 hypothetical protein BO70DRAFT_391753 [Aspergillus heteromorphus CBS 117.55]
MASASPHRYFAEPAAPLLAHSLVSHAGETLQSGQDPRPHGTKAWNLKDDIKTGFRDSNDGVFQTGIVIGFSKLRSTDKDSHEDVDVGQVSFIIHPLTSPLFTPQRLLSSLLTTTSTNTSTSKTPLTRPQAIFLLDSVHLYPITDLPGATAAISQISQALALSLTSPTNPSNPSNPPNPNVNPHSNPHKTLLLLTGLDTLTESSIRSSNALRGAALLSALLRTLTQLSRSHADWLSVLVVNGTSAVGAYSPSSSGGGDGSASASARMGGGDGGIQSAFRAGALFPSLLLRTLDGGWIGIWLLGGSWGEGEGEAEGDG